MAPAPAPAGRPTPRAVRRHPLRLPGAVRTGLARGRLEIRAFFRERQVVVFVFAMPAIMLVLLGSIFGTRPPPAA